MAIKNVSINNDNNDFLNQIQDEMSDDVIEVKTPVINEKPVESHPEVKVEPKPVNTVKPAEVKVQNPQHKVSEKADNSKLEKLAWKAYCLLNNNKKLPFKKLSNKEIAKVLHSYGLVKFGNNAGFSKDLVLAELEKI